MSQYIIGIDLGGTNLKIGLFNTAYTVLEKRVISTATFKTRRDLVNGFVQAVGDIAQQRRIRRNDILGIGIGLPGPVNFEKGIVYSLTNIRGWRDVPLKRILEQKLKIPVFIDNDAKVMSLAEAERGAARGFHHAVCITLGTGVGGGIINNGYLYRGFNNAAGEIGHMPLSVAGDRCNCGGTGCLETFVGNNRIQQDVRRVFGKNVPLEEVSALARKGNRKAREVWNRVGTYLGVAVAAIVNLLNPDCVVIGGGVANAGSVLIDRVKAVVKTRAMKVQAANVKIFKAKLGSDAGLIGSAILVTRGVRS